MLINFTVRSDNVKTVQSILLCCFCLYLTGDVLQAATNENCGANDSCALPHDLSLATDTVPPPWNVVDLTTARMKPFYAQHPKVKFPWLPVTGGAAGAGIATYLILKDDNTDTGAPPVARDDAVTVPCNESATVNVLANDSGEGLQIASVTGTGADIEVLATAVNLMNVTQSTTLTVTIQDNQGRTAMSTLSVTLFIPPAEAVDDMYETNFGETLTANVTANDVGPVIAVTGHTQPAGGMATITPDGTLTFIPADDFEGTTTLTYTITGECGQESGATITINVLPRGCAFTASVTTTDSDCGVSNGMAELTIDPPGTYTYHWSHGATEATVDMLVPGAYTVTVTSPDGNCSEILDVTIAELPPDFQATLSTSAADCGIDNGTATITVEPAGEYQYFWSDGSTGSSVNDLGAGEITVTVTDINDCSQAFSVTISELQADYIESVSSTPGNCLGEGADIILNTQTPANGPMQVDIIGGPHAGVAFSAPPGQIHFSDFLIVLPGTHQIMITDAGVTADCSEEVSIDVEDNTVLTPVDDAYQTPCNTPVSDNVLSNDEGVALMVTAHSTPTGGTVTVAPNGSFTYTPETDSTGQYSFSYFITDACGNIDTAVVVITVTPKCNIDIDAVPGPTQCGLSAGSITLSVLPAGEYTFQWSNGAVTQNLADLPSGSYSVTVTSVDQDCEKDTTIIVEDLPAEYINEISSTPGNCTGEGGIALDISTAGEGPLVVQVSGPEGDAELILDPGQHLLEDHLNLPSGNYMITVYDQGLGDACSEQVEITIEDNTPELTALDDFYQTPFQTAIDANALANDNGLMPEMTVVNNVTGGQVEFESTGAFTFTPDPGFVGEASFTYVVTDACGTTALATVFIVVDPPDCFTAQLVTTNASCGLSDGSATVEVDQPGEYVYTWSTGDQGNPLQQIPPGLYSVTVEDVNAPCEVIFNFQIVESPPAYISGVEVTDATCVTPGDITFVLESPGSGPFDVFVIDPGGEGTSFVVEAGLVSLSDYLDVVPGSYTIAVFDVSIGSDCTEVVNADVGGSADDIVIALEGTMPPSMESSNDGSITVVITSPGTGVHSALLNGMPVGPVDVPGFTLSNLSAGSYTVQVMDENGCLSNILEVDLFPMGTLTMGIGIDQYQTQNSPSPEMPDAGEEMQFVQAVFVGYSFPKWGLRHRSEVTLLTGFPSRITHPPDHSQLRISQTAGPVWHKRGFTITLEGGLNWSVPLDAQEPTRTVQNWVVRSTASTRLAGASALELRMSLRGWESIYPYISCRMRLPLF